jgi:hypothetical protein
MANRLAAAKGLAEEEEKEDERIETGSSEMANRLAAAKGLADEEEEEQIMKELLPKTGDGPTYLHLIKAGAVTLKKVDAPADRPLPTAEQIAEEKRSGGGLDKH